MRHQNAHRKFSRTSAHRQSMFRNMATSLFREERYETTIEKAKDLRPIVEKLVTLARKDTLAARRAAFARLMDKAVVHKLFAEIAPRYKDRKGGYTRIVRTGYRHGDAAQLAIIELVTDEAAPAKKTRKKKAAPKEKAAGSTEADTASGSAA